MGNREEHITDKFGMANLSKNASPVPPSSIPSPRQALLIDPGTVPADAGQSLKSSNTLLQATTADHSELILI